MNKPNNSEHAATVLPSTSPPSCPPYTASFWTLLPLAWPKEQTTLQVLASRWRMDPKHLEYFVKQYNAQHPGEELHVSISL